MCAEETKLDAFQWGRIVAKAWRDADFRDELISDPQKTLSIEGISLMKGIKLEINENTDSNRTFADPRVKVHLYPVISCC